MKKLKTFWEWTTSIEKLFSAMLVMSSIGSLTMVGILLGVISRCWGAIDGFAVGWLIFVLASQVVTFLYATLTLGKFIQERYSMAKRFSNVSERES